jgi:hypothetical protein
MQGCRSTRIDTIQGEPKSIYNYCIDLDAIEVSSSELNQVIQVLINLKATKVEIITDYAFIDTHLKVRAWFEKLSPFMEDNLRYRLGLYFPQYKISLYAKTMN